MHIRYGELHETVIHLIEMFHIQCSLVLISSLQGDMKPRCTHRHVLTTYQGLSAYDPAGFSEDHLNTPFQRVRFLLTCS